MRSALEPLPPSATVGGDGENKQQQLTLDLSGRSLGRDVNRVAELIGSSSSQYVSLNLSNTKLTAEDAVILSKALEFSCLTSLSCEHNPLGYVGVAALSEGLKFSGLKTVSLADTLLNSKGAALIASAIVGSTTLTSLNLETNRVEAEGAFYLADALLHNQTLLSLNLEGNKIGSLGATHIARALEVNETLTWLNLKHNAIAADGATQIGEALARSSRSALCTLSLSKVDLPLQLFRGATGSTTIDLTGWPLSAALDYPVLTMLLGQPNNKCQATKILMRQAAICGVTGDGRGQRVLVGVAGLSRALKTQTLSCSLLLLDLSGAFMDDPACIVLAEGISCLRTLTTLDVSNNDIGVGGTVSILLAIRPSLTELILSGNVRVGPGGGTAIGEFLSDLRRSGGLKVLRASCCGLRSEGIVGMSQGVGANSTLEILDLTGNEVGSAGKAALGNALLHSDVSRLKGFALSSEWAIVPGQRALAVTAPRGGGPAPLAADDDVLLLAGAIRPTRWLTSLELDGNPITAAGCVHLCQALKLSHTIGVVSLQGCGLDSACGRVILELLNSKPGLRISLNNGNNLGEDLLRKWVAVDAASRSLLTDGWTDAPAVTVPVHLLGPVASGKSTLLRALKRSYWDAVLMKGDEERAEDKGENGAAERTRGCSVESVDIEGGNFTFWDHGGMAPLQVLLGTGILNAPHMIYVIVVSLGSSRAKQRSELRLWLQRVQLCMHERAPHTTGMLIVGSRADK